MNDKEIERKQINAELRALGELSVSIQGNADEFLHADSLDKIRRYGRRGFTARFLNNKQRNICSHMKTYVYLTELEGCIPPQIALLEKERIRLDRELGPA